VTSEALAASVMKMLKEHDISVADFRKAFNAAAKADK
jgi:hypothetical protein